MKNPLISICIPAYKNVLYLKRLLESISIQTFTDFEVIITDDSNDNAVHDFIDTNKWNFLVSFFKNKKNLGSPENWNAAVSHAKAEWIKIMHHDDWFSSKTALAVFAAAIKKHPKHNFFFCAYENIYGEGETKKITPPPSLGQKLILNDPAALLGGNIIGPPSVTIYRNDKNIIYDKRLQWLVDMDFYIRYLQTSKSYYIKQTLINIGIHQEQVTKYSFLRPEIEIPEHLVVLNKIGENALKNILVYDAFWRLIRNLKIRSAAQLSTYNKEDLLIPDKLQQMIKHQKKLPAALLAFGPSSKLLMFLSYLSNN